jgi:hypothetical protein
VYAKIADRGLETAPVLARLWDATSAWAESV